MSKGTKQIRVGRITALVEIYERVIQTYEESSQRADLPDWVRLGDDRVAGVYRGVIEDLRKIAGEGRG